VGRSTLALTPVTRCSLWAAPNANRRRRAQVRGARPCRATPRSLRRRVCRPHRPRSRRLERLAAAVRPRSGVPLLSLASANLLLQEAQAALERGRRAHRRAPAPSAERALLTGAEAAVLVALEYGSLVAGGTEDAATASEERSCGGRSSRPWQGAGPADFDTYMVRRRGWGGRGAAPGPPLTPRPPGRRTTPRRLLLPA